jgi:hypothetical protein
MSAAPEVKRTVERGTRCFTGDVLPTSALDALASQSGNSLIDIRAAKEKDTLGVPDLADNSTFWY